MSRSKKNLTNTDIDYCATTVSTLDDEFWQIVDGLVELTAHMKAEIMIHGRNVPND